MKTSLETRKNSGLPAIPALAGQRVALRELCPADLAELMAVNGDPEVTRFLPYATWSTPSDAQAWLERMDGLVASGTARQLVVTRLPLLPEQPVAVVIGTVLLFRFDEGSNRLELGYVLGRAHWHQGLAQEALRLVLAHVFTVLGVRRVEAEVDPENLASNRLLLSLGFQQEGLLRSRWVAKGRTYSVKVYGLLAEEWR